MATTRFYICRGPPFPNMYLSHHASQFIMFDMEGYSLANSSFPMIRELTRIQQTSVTAHFHLSKPSQLSHYAFQVLSRAIGYGCDLQLPSNIHRSLECTYSPLPYLPIREHAITYTHLTLPTMIKVIKVWADENTSQKVRVRVNRRGGVS